MPFLSFSPFLSHSQMEKGRNRLKVWKWKQDLNVAVNPFPLLSSSILMRYEVQKIMQLMKTMIALCMLAGCS